jgi:hypothetical protein
VRFLPNVFLRLPGTVDMSLYYRFDESSGRGYEFPDGCFIDIAKQTLRNHEIS